MVGRDLVVGTIVGLILAFLEPLFTLVPPALGYPAPPPYQTFFSPLMGVRSVIATVTNAPFNALMNGMISMLLLSLIRQGVRGLASLTSGPISRIIGSNVTVALATLVLFVIVVKRNSVSPLYPWLDIASTVVLLASLLAVALRFGELRRSPGGGEDSESASAAARASGGGAPRALKNEAMGQWVRIALISLPDHLLGLGPVALGLFLRRLVDDRLRHVVVDRGHGSQKREDRFQILICHVAVDRPGHRRENRPRRAHVFALADRLDEQLFGPQILADAGVLVARDVRGVGDPPRPGPCGE
jgi:hypothetical protein